jgi:hypothetical protein
MATGKPGNTRDQEVDNMGPVLLVLLLALILGGLGFAVHVLWWVAVVVGIVWLLGFFVRTAEGGRWYRW